MVVSLLPSHRLALSKCLGDNGLNISDFSWDERPFHENPSIKIPALIHASSGYYFEFHVHNEWECIIAFPLGGIPNRSWYKSKSWDSQLEFFREWVRCINIELQAKKELEVISDSYWIDDEFGLHGNYEDSFSESEKIHIASTLDKFHQQLISQITTDQDTSEKIEEHIEDLKKATNRLSKRDWRDKFKGFLYDLAINIGQEAVLSIFRWGVQKLIGT